MLKEKNEAKAPEKKIKPEKKSPVFYFILPGKTTENFSDNLDLQVSRTATIIYSCKKGDIVISRRRNPSRKPFADNGKVAAPIVAGEWKGDKGAIDPLTDIHFAYIDFNRIAILYKMKWKLIQVSWHS